MSEGKFVEVVNKKDKVIGKIERRIVHEKPTLHRAVHVFVFNKKKEIFLQKRPDTMQHYPSLWDSGVGEHTELNETYEKTARRGLKEELNLKPRKISYLTKKAILDKNCFEMIALFKTKFDGKIKISKKEVADGKFFTLKEAQKIMKEGKTTPFFNKLFKWYMHELKNSQNKP